MNSTPSYADHPDGISLSTEYKMLKQAVSSANEWVMLESFNGNIRHITGAFEQITGYPEAEFLKMKSDLAGIIIKQDLPDYLAQIEQFRKSDLKFRIDFRIVTRTGRIKRIEQVVEKFHDADEKDAGWLSRFRDITDNKMILIGQLYENMTEAVMVGDIISDEAGNPIDYTIVMVNQALEKQSGLKSHDIIGKRILEVIPDLDFSWIEKFGKVALSGKPLKFVEYIQRTDKFYELSCFQTLQGQFAVLFSDITKIRQLHNELKKSERLYHSILDNQKQLISRYRPDTTLTFVNPAYCKIFKAAKEELLGTKFTRLLPDEAKNSIRNFIDTFKKNDPPKKIIHQVLLPDQSKAWYEWTVTPIFSDNGELLEIQSVGYDITEQYNAKLNQMETIKRFNIISEYSNTVYWEVDEKGLYKYVSEGCRNIYGYSSDELVGKMYFYDLHPEEDREDFKRKAFKVFEHEDKFDDFHGRMLTREGYIRWLSTSGLPVYDQDGIFRGYRGSDMDITLRKKQQDIINRNMMEIREYQSKLQRLNLALADSEENIKNDIAQFLHDELGQVLSAIHMQLSFIESVDGEVDHGRIFGNINSQLNKAIMQCREMTYELSSPILKKYGINQAIKWKLNEVQNNYGINAEFKSDIEKLQVDDKIKLMIFRMIGELINNVVKHAGATTLKVEIKTQRQGVRFVVNDNGQGFDYDYQKDLSGKNSFGLFNISERMLFLGGKLLIDSGDRGTVASLVFPQM